MRIAQLHPYLDIGSFTMQVHALIVLRLDYCNALHMGLPKKLLRKLPHVQKLAARLLCGVKKQHNISPILATLHWLPVYFCASYNVTILTYKALNGLGCQYLRERLLPMRSVLHNPPRLGG